MLNYVIITIILHSAYFGIHNSHVLSGPTWIVNLPVLYSHITYWVTNCTTSRLGHAISITDGAKVYNIT